jgi:hypothetical protein
MTSDATGIAAMEKGANTRTGKFLEAGPTEASIRYVSRWRPLMGLSRL